MKDILHAKSVILENFEAVEGGPLPPRVANCRVDDRELIKQLRRCFFDGDIICKFKDNCN